MEVIIYFILLIRILLKLNYTYLTLLLQIGVQKLQDFHTWMFKKGASIPDSFFLHLKIGAYMAQIHGTNSWKANSAYRSIAWDIAIYANSTRLIDHLFVLNIPQLNMMAASVQLVGLLTFLNNHFHIITSNVVILNVFVLYRYYTERQTQTGE